MPSCATAIIPFQPKRSRKKPKGKCQWRMCRNNSDDHRKWCAKHKSQLFKKNHPLKYFFNLARSHARRRGFEFSLPFAEYERLCVAANWITENRGRSATDYSMDRIDSSKGYVSGNVRICTISENAAKGDSDISWIKSYGGFFVAPSPDDTGEIAEQLALPARAGDPF